MQRRLLLAAVAVPLARPATLRAQGGAHGAWPSRPLRLLIPWPPGGTTDILSRIIAPPLGDLLGQPVAVENKGGASGAIGTIEMLRSPPDGHTFSIVTSMLVSAA